MTVETFVTAIVSFVRDHQSWAGPIAFLVAFGESFCFLSILWPGTAILAGIAALLAASGVSSDILVPAIIYACLGGTAGYAVSFWLGRHFKESIPKIWPFTSKPHLIEEGKAFFQRYGAFGVFLGHFFGPVRAVIPVVAGMFGMREIPFQIANVLSAFIWAAGVIAPAFYVVNFKDDILAVLASHELMVAGALAVLALLNSIPRPWLFVPTLVLFVAFGALEMFSGGDIVIMWAAGAIGAFLGDVYAYVTGARHSEDTSGAWPMCATPAQHQAARAMVEKSGLLAVVLSKLQGLNRGLVPLETGAAERPFASFAAVSVVAACLWSAVYLLPGILLAIWSHNPPV